MAALMTSMLDYQCFIWYYLWKNITRILLREAGEWEEMLYGQLLKNRSNA